MDTVFKPRHPLLVLVWSFGLLLVMNLHQYLGAIIGSMMGGLSFESVISGKEQNLLSYCGKGLVAGFVGIPLIYLTVKYLWRRSFDWIKLRFDGRLAIGGFAFGLVLPLVVLALVSIIGDVNITATPSRLPVSELAMILVSTLFLMAFVAYSEEAVFRGMAVREWASRWKWPISTVLGGLFFGSMHLSGLDSNSPIISAIWILVAATAVSVLFVALYVRGNSLWLPIAFHAGWNLCLQGILGVTISGKESPFSLYQMNISGPAWLTG